MNADELLTLIRERRSVRRYTAEPVADEDVERMVEAALWAPSGSNRQPWQLTVVRDEEIIKQAGAAIGEEVNDLIRQAPEFEKMGRGVEKWSLLFTEAPLVFFVSGEPQPSRWRTELARLLPEHPIAPGRSWFASCAAAIQNLLLMAHALGYGACWLAAPLIAQARLERLIELPETRELLALVSVGRADETPKPPPRRPREETVQYL